MKYIFPRIFFLILFFVVSVRAQQRDLIESGALREDGERFSEYRGDARLSKESIKCYRNCFSKYAISQFKREEERVIAQTQNLEWQYTGKFTSLPENKGRTIALLYSAGNAMVIVYNDVVMMQWVIENHDETTRKKYVLIVGRDQKPAHVTHMVMEE